MHRTIQTHLGEGAKRLSSQSVTLAAYRGEAQMLRVLSCVLAFAIAGYLYFVGVSILNVIMSREAAMASEHLQSEVATLEQEYFTLSKEVSTDTAAAHGLTQPVATTFVKAQANYAVNVAQ